MVSLNQLVVVCLLYVVVLFVVAFLAERAATRGQAGWLLRSPLVYTLSLSIYCTAWTFYGAVGYAARSGLEYVTIYLGPSLVMIGWWWVLRRLVHIGRTQRVTSVADLISSRYGKSNTLATVVTVMSVIGVTPYIALQLQSVVLSLSIFAAPDLTAVAEGLNAPQAAFWVAAGLAVFTVIFGTRNLNVNDRHPGVVMAVAVEAVVKLFALLAVGGFVVWGLAGGLEETLSRLDASKDIGTWQVQGGRWVALTMLSAAAFLCLPRMFQVMVVENDDDRHLQIASWAFPLYLMLMSLFVVPIAVVGLDLLPEGSDPDLFVLSLPLSQGQNGLAMLAFLGGFSSATSMVIVATLALSTMVSNHIVMPVWLASRQDTASQSGDVRNVIILSRRLSILLIIALGYLYYRTSGGGALAAIGTISFGGVAQFLPAMLGGLFWRGATRFGALFGLGTGFALWVFTMLLPSFGQGVALSVATFEQGLLGLSWLRPQALFGIVGLDPTVHAVVWSLSLNTLVFVVVSLFTFPSPIERLQGAQFVTVQDSDRPARSWAASVAGSEDLMIMAQRILGAREAQAFFQAEARAQGQQGDFPEPTPRFVQDLERELAASVGAATAHAMVGQIVGGTSVSVQDLLAVADESAQMLEYSSQLEAKSQELSDTAAELRRANEKLTQLSAQKDAFLSQISHELRTPMTSIRSFSEILRDAKAMKAVDKKRYASIIHNETIRLTRLLDDLLDLSVLENGQVTLHKRAGRLGDVLDQAVTTASAGAERPLRIRRDTAQEDIKLFTDLDRLAQVFINLVANAQKYCEARDPELDISVTTQDGQLVIDFADNGQGIAKDAQGVIFEKFFRISGVEADGAGLGLSICREIMTRLGGSISYVPGQAGTAFRVTLPMTGDEVKPSKAAPLSEVI